MDDDFPQRSGRSIASHLEVTIDPNNPPPTASPAFTTLREKVENIWKEFEAAENALTELDDDVNNEVLDWVSSHQRATGPEVRKERTQITTRLHEPRIAEAERCWRDLEAAFKALREAAVKEPETIEAQATLEIDVKVMSDSLGTVRDIIEVAQIQLDAARSMLITS